MDPKIKSALLDACRLLLRPIASVVMKCGITWREFSELSKSVFVHVATDEFGIRGRPTNVSRVSLLTGISRKEVKRQRELLAVPGEATPKKTTDATRLLSGWYQDPDFLGEDGDPTPLPEHGSNPSFEALFDRYGGDTPHQTLLKELIGAESVEMRADGMLVAKTRYHLPTPMNESFISFLGTNLYDHALALSNNLSAGTDVDPRFEGFAVDDCIDPRAAPEFKQFVDSRAQQFLEEVDDWLNTHRADESVKKTVPARLGVGIYAIEGQLPVGNSL
jgi:hypothetical protein